MSYSVPQFNLLANIWDCRFPSDGDPDWFDVPVQKYIRSRMSLDTSPQAADGFWRVYAPPIQLRFPRSHLAFTGVAATWDHACFEVPAGSGAFYRTYWREIQHEGFPNEYAIILVNPCTSDGLATGPPLAESALGTTPDVCASPPPPPPPEDQLVQCNFWVPTDNMTGRVGVMARLQDQANYYIFQYLPGGESMELGVVVGDAYTPLDSASSIPFPDVDSFMFLQLLCEGDTITGHLVHDNFDGTISVTDTTFDDGPACGFVNEEQAANDFNAYRPPPGTPVCSDDFQGADPGDNITSYAMPIGSGWYYGTSGSDYTIVVVGSVEMCGPNTGGYATSFPVAMTDYP